MSIGEWAGQIQRVALLLSIFPMIHLTAPCMARPVHGQAIQEIPEKDVPAAASSVESRAKLEYYKGKNGILSVKTVVMGGSFRVTTVVPFRGNLADYHRLEITKPVSLVGGALSSEVAHRQVARIKAQFESRKIFECVTVIDSYSPPAASMQQKQIHTNAALTYGDVADSLDAPIGSLEDMEARDRERALKEHGREQASNRTLVTVIEVLDYAKGSRLKQALPLDLGKSILTVRLRYYDRDTGQEIGRQIISGKSDGSSLLGPLSPRDGLSGVTDGFVDQVTRRVAASAR
jgi:hypothetical protein